MEGVGRDGNILEQRTVQEKACQRKIHNEKKTKRERQTDRQTGRQAGRQAGRQTDRQTGGQAERENKRMRERIFLTFIIQVSDDTNCFQMSKHFRCCHRSLHQPSKQKCFKGLLVYNRLHAKLYQHFFAKYCSLGVGGGVTA